MNTESQLDRLEDDRIFSVDHDDDGFVFVEKCDSYFEVRLTRAEFVALIEEMRAMLDAP